MPATLPRLLTSLVVCVVVLGGCVTRTGGPFDGVAPPPPAALRGAVASPDRFGADVAEDVLARGGNAVDAAVAMAFALAVTYPEAGNIGGGGFMLIHMDGQDFFLDYRETAPAAASADMYLDERGEIVEDLSLVGHLAAGVPGTVAGLYAAHQRFGSLPWAEVLGPAIALARAGFVVPPLLAERVAETAADLAGRTNFAQHFATLQSGRRFAQHDLADVLTRIALDGPDGFYRGATAALIAASMRRHGGLITTADLAAYAPVWRAPLRATWRGRTVVGAPPPSSGGFAVLQLLGMKAALADAFDGLAHNSPQYIHLMAEMEKRVFADRAEYFGDPDVVDVPIDALVDPAYIARRAAEVNRNGISALNSARPGLPEGRHTTHFNVVDGRGNAVANTYTLNTSFGSGAVVEGAGFLLNNEMDDFSAKPDAPNVYGVVGGDANAIAPGKRMLSSMSPTILRGDAGVEMVIGTPGGSTIFTSVFQGIVNIIEFGMTPDEAADATRVHHQLLPPDEVTFSPLRPLGPDVVAGLGALGYRAVPHSWSFGDLQILMRDGAGWVGGSDSRGRGEWRQIFAQPR